MDKLKGILFAALSAATFGFRCMQTKLYWMGLIMKQYSCIVTGSREFYTLSIYCFEEPICG